jgi:hypothetical protein
VKAKLSVKTIRELVKQLRGAEIKGPISLPMRDDLALTVNGVVVIPGVGYLHAECFRELAGEEAYQELLKRPRVVCEYDYED